MSDHIEKLVLHLKHESAGKTKALRKLAKEIESKKSKVASLQRKNVIKVRFLLRGSTHYSSILYIVNILYTMHTYTMYTTVYV